jgi:cyanamide hydratase family protein with HD domain
VQTHFPHLTPVLETYYLTCLLHDLGTTGEHMHGTHMSFEYYGSFKAMKFLLDIGVSKDQAEAVSEAIIRHADLGETGTLTTLGMLIQLSTVFGKSLASFSLVILKRYLHCREVRGPWMTSTTCIASIMEPVPHHWATSSALSEQQNRPRKYRVDFGGGLHEVGHEAKTEENNYPNRATSSPICPRKARPDTNAARDSYAL